MKKSPPIKQHWLDRAIEVHNFHVQCMREGNWSLTKTSEALNRSVGSVSQDLLIASWIRTHEKQLRKLHSQREALEFIRSKQNEMRLEEV